MTTGNAKIGRSTTGRATNRDVAVLHTIVCEIPNPINNNNLQLGQAVGLNPIVYVIKIRFPLPVGPGIPGTLR
jgi:hypothetical protein